MIIANQQHYRVLIFLFVCCRILQVLCLISPAGMGVQPASRLSCATCQFRSNMVFLEATSRVGCCQSIAFLFQDKPVATENFYMERHWTVISIAAVQEQRSVQVALEQLQQQQEGSPIPGHSHTAVRGIPVPSAAFIFLWDSTEHQATYVGVELMKSELVALTKTFGTN